MKNRPGYYVRDQRGGIDRRYHAASLEEARALRDRIKGRAVPLERKTVAEIARDWVKRGVVLTRNEAGAKLAGQRVEADLIPALGMRRLSMLSAEDCRAYRLTLEAKERKSGARRSPQTVAHLLSDLRAMLIWAEGSGLIDRSPFPRKLLPRVPERAPDRLTDDEVAKLAALREPFGFYVRLLVGTGLRWGELVRAESGHVERGMLLVPQSKSGKVRRVPLSPALAAELKGRVGRLCHLVNAQALALVGREVVPGFRVHQLRHTFASRWMDQGGNPATLQAIMGHASITTTQRYGRLSEAAIRSEAGRIQAQKQGAREA